MPVFCAIHTHRHAADHYRHLMGLRPIPYHWIAERHRTSNARRERILTYWFHVHRQARRRYHAWRHRALGVPPWFITDINCISTHEEYGVTGQNTVAGYFGMIYPPGSYPAPGPTYARLYGNAWLDIPLSAQYAITYAEYETYGWSPWSTHGLCGL